MAQSGEFATFDKNLCRLVDFFGLWKNRKMTTIDKRFFKDESTGGRLFSLAPVQELLPNTVKSAGQAACISNQTCLNADHDNTINLADGGEKIKRTRSSPK